MRLLLHIFLILLYAVPAYTADEPKVEAQLSTTTFSTSQGSLLSVNVIGDRNPEVRLPEIDGIDFQPRGKYSQISLINGSMTSSLALQYIVTAHKEGTYTLDGIRAEIDGKTYKADPISFTVKNKLLPKDDDDDGEDGEDLAFMEIKLKSTVYLGEKIPLEIHAFFSGKQQIELNSSPQILGEDISMKTFSQNPQQQKTQKKNTLYNELIWTTELSSVSSGTFPITFQLDASILEKEANHSSLGGFNDPLFPSMFSTTTRTPLRIMSKEEELHILPLPIKNQPDDFSGAVGQFSLQVIPGTQKADIGEPVQVTIILTGKGNFDLVHIPHIIENSQWKSYPAQKIEDQQTHQKRFQQVLVAKEGGNLILPQYKFSYFDPEKKEYVTLFSKETPIQIVGEKSVPKITDKTENEDIKREEPQKIEVNLVEQHLDLGRTCQNITPLFLTTWFLVILFILVLLLLYFIFKYSRSKKREKNAHHYQQLALYKELKQECLEIQNHIDEGKYQLVQNNLVFLMQQYFGFHLQQEPRSISPHSLRSLKKSENLIQMFNNITSASYAGASLSATELTEIVTTINKQLEADL